MTKFLIMHKEILENKLLCSRAKILFMLLHSRRSLSLANGYTDAEGKPYVFCSPDSAATMLSCSRKTALSALKNLTNYGFITSCGRNRYYIKKIDGQFVMILQGALSLGNDCAVLYAFIASRILSSLKTFCAFKNTEIQSALSCGNKKACELLSALERERLIEVRRSAKGNILSLTGKMAKMTLRIISDKLSKIKAKKTENADSFLPRRDVKKEIPTCENCQDQSVIFTTKLNNSKLDNYIYISSEDLRDQISQKLSLENYKSRHKKIITALKEAVSTKRKNMWVGGELCPKTEIIEKIAALSVSDIADICENVLKRDNICNLKNYALTCLMNYTVSASKAAKREHSYDINELAALAIGIAPNRKVIEREHSYNLEKFEELAVGYTPGGFTEPDEKHIDIDKYAALAVGVVPSH
ncbi:MAG: replication initiator protein A [Oscillospiraceae bacterium]|nr:replication initiator protein A [Oscillospiraceae bacterium]